jgi:hypothetical protein
MAMGHHSTLRSERLFSMLEKAMRQRRAGFQDEKIPGIKE